MSGPGLTCVSDRAQIRALSMTHRRGDVSGFRNVGREAGVKIACLARLGALR